MSITIYRDQAANAIFIEDANGVQFINSLQATISNGFCSIRDLAKGLEIVTDVSYTEFVDQNGNSYGNNATEVCDALNALFSASGTSGSELPVITSNLTANLVVGETLNYELTADYGVGYEWDLSGVSGVTTVEGNPRKLIGGSSLTAGTYNIPVTAINYNGEDSETIVLTVSTPPFANTKSVQFTNQDYCGANAALLDTDLGRSSNGSGAGDAWTIAFWFKGGTTTVAQTIFYYGSNDITNGGHVEIRFLGQTDKIRLRYGSSNNYLQLATPTNSCPASSWKHVVVTYDGGTTGSSSADVSDYYSRFNIYIDGVSQTLTTSNLNYGWSSAISGQNLRVGRYAAGNYLNGAKVDELAVWDSDQSANVSDIYNGGTPFDLSTLTTEPKHWWRMGDGDTYPNLQDSGTEANCVFQMYNMTVADIVSDVP